MNDRATTWRLIVTPPLPGAENMAIDEALLRSFDPATSLPVLRLYGWEPAALSLGRFQKGGEVLDLERCRRDAVPIVRRITGGGVIFHADELTYSIVCSPEQIPPASSVKDSFRVLTGFLLAFYRELGLTAAYAVDMLSDAARLGERTPFCFAGRESFDILLGGGKIGGNAQRRQKGLVFQHGSIPLVNRAMTGLSYMRDKEPAHARGVTSLAECGIATDCDRLRHLLAAAFAAHFGTELLADALTEGEREAAGMLLARKYSTESWNLEGVEE
ncbi:MAG TPA: lipoate--protein ligase family protein [Desulfuromonadaceae bacterium]